MKFFDRQEEVIDIELTQYGKRQLMQGKFKPVYYAFFDDDILYDARWSSGTEEQQSDIEGRIKETPRLKTQYAYDGIQTDFANATKFIRTNKAFNTKVYTQERLLELLEDKFREDYTSQYSLGASLGNSDPNSPYVPAWSVKYINGELSSSTSYISNERVPVIIPQLSSSVTYITYITYYNEDGTLKKDYLKTNSSEELSGDDDYGIDVLPKEYEDHSTVQIQDDYLLLNVEEKNTIFENENFDVEVFLSSSDDGVRKLYFQSSEDEDVDERFVEYYFDLLVDNEIESKYLCSKEDIKKTENIFMDAFDKCEKKVDGQVIIEDIYDSISLNEEDIEEPC